MSIVVRIERGDHLQTILNKLKDVPQGSFVKSTYERDETRGIVLEFEVPHSSAQQSKVSG